MRRLGGLVAFCYTSSLVTVAAVSPVCTDRNIPRLVYTSTINVVFTGEPIKECDESSASYVPPDKVSMTGISVISS